MTDSSRPVSDKDAWLSEASIELEMEIEEIIEICITEAGRDLALRLRAEERGFPQEAHRAVVAGLISKIRCWEIVDATQ